VLVSASAENPSVPMSCFGRLQGGREREERQGRQGLVSPRASSHGKGRLFQVTRLENAWGSLEFL
jgi:hypothetical protein